MTFEGGLTGPVAFSRVVLEQFDRVVVGAGGEQFAVRVPGDLRRISSEMRYLFGIFEIRVNREGPESMILWR